MLTLIALILILLMTAYFASQGLFTSTLNFAAATFASVLAFGLLEPLARQLDSFRPEYSRGVMFLLLFMLTYGILRVTSDLLVPKNITLPKWIDLTGASIMGVFASLMIIGTLFVGTELLPLNEAIIGPTDARVESNPLARAFPARFVTSIYYLVNGRSLGGADLACTHPDLSEELPGYRHTLQPQGHQTLDPDLLSIKRWYELPLNAHKIPAPAGTDHLLVVRTSIDKGSTPPKVSVDPTSQGDYLMLTSPEIRLVVKSPSGECKQIYPIGDLRNEGFEPLPTYTGFVLEDFDAKNASLLHDWVFPVAQGDIPTLIEIKRGARKELDDSLKSPKPLPVLTASEQTPRTYLKTEAQITLDVTYGGHGVKGSQILVIHTMTLDRPVHALIQKTYTDLENNLTNYNQNQNGWSKALEDLPGAPKLESLKQNINRLRDTNNTAPDQLVNWEVMLPPMFYSVMGPNPKENITRLQNFVNRDLTRAIEDSTSLLHSAYTNDAGHCEPFKLPADTYLILVISKTDNRFIAFFHRLELKPSEPATLQLKLEEAFLDTDKKQ